MQRKNFRLGAEELSRKNVAIPAAIGYTAFIDRIVGL